MSGCGRRRLVEGVFGWSIADHLRTGLVVVALGMACWRRKPVPGQVIHLADYGTQYSFWVFGQRLRQVGLFGSLGTVVALDSALAESFFGTLQLELLDRRIWQTCRELAQAVFEYIEAFCNPVRRHTSINNLSLVDYEMYLASLSEVA